MHASIDINCMHAFIDINCGQNIDTMFSHNLQGEFTLVFQLAGSLASASLQLPNKVTCLSKERKAVLLHVLRASTA